MPTVPVYVSASLARQIAARWEIEPDGDAFYEVIRSLLAEMLEREAGITHPHSPFNIDCTWVELHRAGHRCRHCGGS